MDMQTMIGMVEKTIYSSEVNGYYTVLQVASKEARHTVIINLPSPPTNVPIKFVGEWSSHAKFGQQFKAISYDIHTEGNVHVIRTFLEAGTIRHIGAKVAERIIEEFGNEALDIIENTPEQLVKVKGINERKAQEIHESYKSQLFLRDLIAFLAKNGISTAYAGKIFGQYEQESINVLQSQPYRLAVEIDGIGFASADKIAMQLNMATNHPERISAAISYSLTQCGGEGHCFTTVRDLTERVAELTKLPLSERDLLTFNENYPSSRYTFEDDRVYLQFLYRAETTVAERLKHFIEQDPIDQKEPITRFINEWQDSLKVELNIEQRNAILRSAKFKLSILTGPPGSGKTTVLRAICDLFEKYNFKIACAAPTGRAAKRMSEATGRGALTVHRLLGYNGRTYEYNQDEPLDADFIVVDEVSMLDIDLASKLLRAIKPQSRILFVGDFDQLPSVGPGNYLRDMIESTVIPTTFLRSVFRQSKGSNIGVNAVRINHGEQPFSCEEFIIVQAKPEDTAKTISQIYEKEICENGLDPIQEIQVLAPMYAGKAGIDALNLTLRENTNPPKDEKPEKKIIRNKQLQVFRLFDKVMQIKNNYNKDVYNGDVGSIINIQDDGIKVAYADKIVEYNNKSMEELVPAFATTIHKSQGSEYNVVVISLLQSHYMLLQRNLLYTGVTRAKQRVYVVGEAKAISMAVRNNQIKKRNTYLKERLVG